MDDEFFDYEAGIFALGGEILCPECEIGYLLKADSEDAQTLVCDMCDEEFEIQEVEQ